MRGVIQFLSGTRLRLAIAAGPVSESPKRRRGASRNDCEIGQPNTDWEKADDRCKHGVLLRCTGCRPSRCHFGAGSWHALVTEMKSVLIGYRVNRPEPPANMCRTAAHRGNSRPGSGSTNTATYKAGCIRCNRRRRNRSCHNRYHSTARPIPIRHPTNRQTRRGSESRPGRQNARREIRHPGTR